MTTGLQTVIDAVKDLAQAKALFGKLLVQSRSWTSRISWGTGWPVTTWAVIPMGTAKGQAAPLGYWNVEDINTSVAEPVEAGATEQQGVHYVGAGTLIATVTDADAVATSSAWSSRPDCPTGRGTIKCERPPHASARRGAMVNG